MVFAPWVPGPGCAAMVRAQGQPPEDLVVRVARRIAAVRLSRKLTQEALAQTLGIATKNLQAHRVGPTEPHPPHPRRDRLGVGGRCGDLVSRPTQPTPRDTWASLIEAGITVLPRDDSPPKTAVAVYSLAAAAGSLGNNRAVERLAWAVVPKLRPVASERHFLARVAGRSMEPLIPDGAWCLFRAEVSGPLEGRIVLVQHRDIRDPETDGAYALKRLGGIEVDPEGISVRLESLNPQHRPYRVRLSALAELRPVAEFVRVVAPRAPSTGRPTRRRRDG
ncbi:MAG: S24 family peptidase [Deltaproteobacteria bacterium]|nr:S24 family peptidase [Deltaproteobacteria bacterium]